MTRDLVKKMADFFAGEEFYEKGEDARLELSPDDVRCMNEVIKACGVAISRQAVLDIDFHKLIHTTAKPAEMIRQKIEQLPPVKPQEKTGHWIRGHHGFECSNCHKFIEGEWDDSIDDITGTLFCPNCEARMESEE